MSRSQRRDVARTKPAATGRKGQSAGVRASKVDARAEVDRFFEGTGWKPFRFQRSAWRAYAAGDSGLVHSATGSGKSLSVWMGPLMQWMRAHPDRNRWSAKTPPPIHCLWVTPLRALAADTAEALGKPLRELKIPWTLEIRTGDTTASRKARQLRTLPTALITTPESLSLMLTRETLHRPLSELRCVVVDEWHELLGTKRGVLTELALARLRSISPGLQTWGLSATLGNLQEALAALVGPESADSARLIRGVSRKKTRFYSVLPKQIERFPWAGHIGTKMVPEVAAEVDGAESSLIFANTRSQTEIWYRQLLQHRPDWAGQIALHHGSLDSRVRSWVEQRLREGKLKAVVCTSSLDLGVDFTAVDLVVQIGSPKGAARLLQRAGRSGHQPDAISRLAFVPTHALELMELAAAQDSIASGDLESRPTLDAPLDVLAQHLVTVAIGGGFQADAMLTEVRRTLAYQTLSDQQWQWTLDFVVRGGSTLQAYPEFRRVELVEGRYVVNSRRIAALHRMNIGTIVSDAAMRVKYMQGKTLGTVEESYISKLSPGDKFLLAGRLVELVRVKNNEAWVKRASGSPDSVPRWMGGRMPLSSELSRSLRRKFEQVADGQFQGREMRRLQPLLELQSRWSHLPAADELLIEAVRTREGHHLFFYPFAGRLAHEGLAAMLAYRLSRRQPISFTMACNDYGLVLTSPTEAKLQSALAAGLLAPEHLEDDLKSALNATEMSRRAFRAIARIAGLISGGYPGRPTPNKHLQASSNMFFEVFRQYDPENLLLRQCDREVLEHQLNAPRMRAALERTAASRIILMRPPKMTPLSFGLWVDRLRERVSSEKLADRIARMRKQLERASEEPIDEP